MIQQSYPRFLPNWFEHLFPHMNLHTNVYNSFIHNSQKMEAIKMSFNREMDKQLHIHTEYHSAVQRNNLW